MLDVVIVGAGPAGLSAALVLGRCRRRVLLCDHGSPRNAKSTALHGYLTRDGINPHELRRLGRDELRPYGIEVRDVAVVAVNCRTEGFQIILETGERVDSQTILLATGVRDHVPAIEGLDACYGITVFHCPYCDGWEMRDRQLAVIGQGAGAAGLALALKTWSEHVVICSDGRSRLTPSHRGKLADHSITIHEGRVAKVEHHGGHVTRVILHKGAAVPCEAIFFTAGQSPQSDIARELGCDLTHKGVVKTDHLGHTRVPGLYVVGDASRDVQFAIVAAAEGAKAGVAINTALQARAGRTVAAVPL